MTAVALREAIGGGLLGELHGQAGDNRYTVYLDDNRTAKGLPVPEAVVAAARRAGLLPEDARVSR